MSRVRTTDAAQRGSALVMALVFLMVFSILLTALLGYVYTNSRVTNQTQAQRNLQYSTDSALDSAVNYVARTTNLGRDPEYFTNDPACVYQQPASTTGPKSPAITVVCNAVDGADSGRQEEPGVVPDTSILTLGRRMEEPGNYNDNTDCPAGNEQGILVRETKSCTGLFGPSPAQRGPWNVVGPIASNSSIQVDAGTVTARTATGAAAPIIARTACGVQSLPACQVVGQSASNALLNDPGYSPRPLTVDGRTGGTPLSVRSMPTSCGGPLTTIQPGIYTDAANVNALFASASCRDKTIWFQPGVYYFNFVNGGNSFSTCGNVVDANFFSSSVYHQPANNRHLWCIGATNNTNVRVVGGTPFGWDGANPPTLENAFPRDITADDPGGDCDPTKAGVQFIFGGDSRLYVADGTFELCAGPDPNSPSNRPQIPLYGVPALPELISTNATTRPGITGAANARVIGEPTGRVQANLTYEGHCDGADDPRQVDCFLGFGSGTIESEALTLSGFGSGFSIPAGTAVQKVEMRASYDTNKPPILSGTSPKFRIKGPGFDCGDNFGLPAQDGTLQREIDVTACLGGGNSGRLSSGFSVDWIARGNSICAPLVGCQSWTDSLEGIQFVVTVAGTSASTLTPGSGCIVDHPNYQDGLGDDDCALFKVDQSSVRGTILSIPIAGSAGWVGRASFKGTIYAPSAALDFSDEDAQYPLFSRGIIARHLRLKAFYSQAGVPMADVQISPKVFERQVEFTACVQGSGGSANSCSDPNDVIVGTARVRYRLDTSMPSTSTCTQTNAALQKARCPDIQEWQIERGPALAAAGAIEEDE